MPLWGKTEATGRRERKVRAGAGLGSGVRGWRGCRRGPHDLVVGTGEAEILGAGSGEEARFWRGGSFISRSLLKSSSL